MTITNLRLVNFRCFDDQAFDFSENINIIIGPNAIGKTSLIEAIYIVNNGKSFRQDDNIIQENKTWARIDTHLSNNKYQTVKINGGDKLYETDLSEEESRQTSILFEPNELFLFYQNPGDRRTYIDKRIASQDIGYEKTLNDYKKILFQRNNLLKNKRSLKETIFVWDVRLAETAKTIVEKRENYIKKIDESLTDTYRQISAQKETINIDYTSNVPLGDNYTSNLLKALTNNIDKDMQLGHTSYGPHRDDIVFTISGKGLKHTASRGEIRSIMLAMKKIEAEGHKTKPVILLDDVFSELDSKRRQKIVKLFKDYQVFITTTEADLVINKLRIAHKTIVF